MLPWKCGRPSVWDATCSDTFDPSYTNLATTRAGSIADLAQRRKASQYLQSSYLFSPVSVETLGSFGKKTGYFLREIARRIKTATGEAQSFHHLIQRLSVAIQRGNAMSILGTFDSRSMYVRDTD